MSEQNATAIGEGHDVQLWEPDRILRRVAPGAAALSCGFLRCHPEGWFPAFADRWIAVTHALGLEVRLSDVKPLANRPPMDGMSYVGVVLQEEMVVGVDSGSASLLREELVPGATERAGDVVLEYFMRRFISSLALTWSGAEVASVSFRHSADPKQVSVAGSIRISFTINTVPITVWVGLGQKLVAMFDGLWRRQVQLMAKSGGENAALRVEVAQLLIPPQMLSDYLTKGTVIDLEVRASDSVTLKLGNRAWMPAQLVNVGGVFGCEMAPGALTVPASSEGATQLCVELGSATVSADRVAELSQGGAIFVTDIPVLGKAQLTINQEKVGDARLCLYEGRFAIEVE